MGTEPRGSTPGDRVLRSINDSGSSTAERRNFEEVQLLALDALLLVWEACAPLTNDCISNAS